MKHIFWLVTTDCVEIFDMRLPATVAGLSGYTSVSKSLTYLRNMCQRLTLQVPLVPHPDAQILEL